VGQDPGQGLNDLSASALVSLSDGRTAYVGPISKPKIFDPKANSWAPLQAAATYFGEDNRSRSYVALADGRILGFGGQLETGNGAPLLDTIVFNPDTGQGARVGDLGNGRVRPAATVLPSGSVFVIGGTAIALMQFTDA
jgi:hypothetical protein